ncbi:MAG TPA: MBL fold metallo-hydrolase [Pyrinomonadaceae bacterium]|nr:MBL fold metallo-hydrolase [Pyrinomonadaceae bacterium]
MTPAKIKTYARFARQHARSFLSQRMAEAGKPIAAARHRPRPASWDDEALTVAWLGHATVLINFYGTWLVTDPALRPHVGVRLPGLTIGPRRIVSPALKIDELPPLDAVLLSHAHMDHSDLGTLKRLPRRAEAVVQQGNSDLVRRFRRVHALGWGESVEIKGARIESIRVNHWGARSLTDKHRGYGGFLITKRGRSLVFGGDTAYTNSFATLAARARIDLAILPIGGYDPYIHAHANPEQAWAMRREMDAQYILPMHHSTFRLSREPVKEPIKRLLAAAGEESWRVALTEPGQTWTLSD